MTDEEVLNWLKEKNPIDGDLVWTEHLKGKVVRSRFRKIWWQFRDWRAVQPYEYSIARQKDIVRGADPIAIVFDEEVCPAWGWFYDPYKKNNIINVEGDPQVVAFSYGYLNEEKVYGKTIADYPSYKAGRFNVNDFEIVKDLHAVLMSADILIGFNSDNFDIKTANARFWHHGLPEIPKTVKIDTMKHGKREFRLTKHSLKDTLRYKQLGEKAKETHAQLLWPCLDGDMEAWKKMRIYCDQDVYETRKLYLSERGYMKNHPNLSFFTRGERECPTCLSKEREELNKNRSYRNGIRKLYQCKNCGHCYEGELLTDGFDKIKTY